MPAAHASPLPLLSNSVFTSLHSGALCSGHPLHEVVPALKDLGCPEDPTMLSTHCGSFSQRALSLWECLCGWSPLVPHPCATTHICVQSLTHAQSCKCTTTPLYRHTNHLSTHNHAHVSIHSHTHAHAHSHSTHNHAYTHPCTHTHSGLSCQVCKGPWPS